MSKKAREEHLMVALRTRVLRHEFLQGLWKNQARMLCHSIFGNRLRGGLLATGVLDDDISHFAAVALANSDVANTLAAYQECQTTLARTHKAMVRAPAAVGAGAGVHRARHLQEFALWALMMLREFRQTDRVATDLDLVWFAVVSITTDGALQLVGQTASPGSPVALVETEEVGVVGLG